MDETPAVPTPPPEIPKGKLWAALAMPWIVTVLGSLIALPIANSRGNYGAEFLVVLPVALIAIIVGTVQFQRAWRIRYRGRSLVITTIGYFLGQIILCLALWFGCCMIPDVYA